MRDLEKLNPHIRRRVFSDIEKLRENPRPPGSKLLVETAEKLYRIAVGPGKNYRAVYQIVDEILLVTIVKVGDRKEVYRRLK
jgi:mRNA interferase RelE/StbE